MEGCRARQRRRTGCCPSTPAPPSDRRARAADRRGAGDCQGLRSGGDDGRRRGARRRRAGAPRGRAGRAGQRDGRQSPGASRHRSRLSHRSPCRPRRFMYQRPGTCLGTRASKTSASGPTASSPVCDNCNGFPLRHPQPATPQPRRQFAARDRPPGLPSSTPSSDRTGSTPRTEPVEEHLVARRRSSSGQPSLASLDPLLRGPPRSPGAGRCRAGCARRCGGVASHPAADREDVGRAMPPARPRRRRRRSGSSPLAAVCGGALEQPRGPPTCGAETARYDDAAQRDARAPERGRPARARPRLPRPRLVEVGLALGHYGEAEPSVSDALGAIEDQLPDVRRAARPRRARRGLPRAARCGRRARPAARRGRASSRRRPLRGPRWGRGTHARIS